MLTKALTISCAVTGIGKATVERLATEGATVAIFDSNREVGQEVAAGFRLNNLSVKFYPVDVSNKVACAEATKSFTGESGGLLHLLVNCAVYFGSKGLTAEKADWDKSFSVNVIGYANTVQAAFEYMKDTPGWSILRVFQVIERSHVDGHIRPPRVLF